MFHKTALFVFSFKGCRSLTELLHKIMFIMIFFNHLWDEVDHERACSSVHQLGFFLKILFNVFLWLETHHFTVLLLPDIVHRDLKLENILVKNASVDNNDKINIKVRWWDKPWNVPPTLLIHSVRTGSFSFLPISSRDAHWNPNLLCQMCSSLLLWYTFLEREFFNQITSSAQHVALTSGRPKQMPSLWSRAAGIFQPALHHHYRAIRKDAVYVVNLISWVDFPVNSSSHSEFHVGSLGI